MHPHGTQPHLRQRAIKRGGLSKGVAACRWHASSDRPSRQARQRMLPPLELDYIKPSPSHAGKLSPSGDVGAWEGVSERQWRSAANRSQLPLRSALNGRHWRPAPDAAAETRGWVPHSFPARQGRRGRASSNLPRPRGGGRKITPPVLLRETSPSRCGGWTPSGLSGGRRRLWAGAGG